VQYPFPVELLGCTEFEWDAGNERKSADKHGVSQAEAEQVFTNRPILFRPTYGLDGEARQLAHGKTDAGRLLTVVFTVRGTLIRVISARAMREKDRDDYGQR
jgi:uncharacterized DUF497 family protein